MEGGIPKFRVKRSDDVLSLIPEDGTPIRFKQLKEKCEANNISYRIMLKELKRLEDMGMILKEGVVAKRGEKGGAGTQYRLRELKYSLPREDPVGALEASIRASKFFVERMKFFGKTEYEQEMEAARNLNYALDMVKLSIIEALFYYDNSGVTRLHALRGETEQNEQQEKELESDLKDKIFPLIMRLKELIVVSEACGERARAIMQELTKEAWFKYEKKWDEILTIYDHPDFPFK
jgi:hypothetical protein